MGDGYYMKYFPPMTINTSVIVVQRSSNELRAYKSVMYLTSRVIYECLRVA
jgi:hypothetical protein